MAEIRATFNVEEFENYGANSSTSNLYLSPEQLTKVISTEVRVNAQLDWLAQILGWSGDYWSGFSESVAQKRQLLTGTFGLYNSFIYPVIVEVRNWENSVVVEADSRLLADPVFYLGDFSYKADKIEKTDETYTIFFTELSQQFYDDLAIGQQLKAISKQSQPSPFYRPIPGTSGDATFICDTSGLNLVLYPGYDTGKTLPYVYNCLIQGSRYYFDKPVTLQVSQNLVVQPLYDFPNERWYIDVPLNSADAIKAGGEPSSTLAEEALLCYNSTCLNVSLVQWADPSDWGYKNVLENFRGVWNNKGGRLPFNFVFDALGIHGFDEKKSVLLEPFQREIPFDSLLNFVYFQKAIVSPDPPGGRGRNQVWWDTTSNELLVYVDDPLNCGPWVEIDYPVPPVEPPDPDLVFSDLAAFNAYSQPIAEGALVEISNVSGMGPSFDLLGLTQTLVGPGKVRFFQGEGQDYWTPVRFIFDDLADLLANAQNLPAKVPVLLSNSAGLAPTVSPITVSNLSFTITESLPILMMKDTGSGVWYISPPSDLRYIGDTRLFGSSIDYNNPIEGELNWDFAEVDPNLRAARMFYYNTWVEDPLTNEWSLQGEWIDVNSQTTLNPIPSIVNFGALKVYCDKTLIGPDEQYRTNDYQLTYGIRPLASVTNFSQVSVSQPQGTYPDVPIVGGSGSGAKATVTVDGLNKVTSVIVTSGGLNYQTSDTGLTLGGSGYTGFTMDVEQLKGVFVFSYEPITYKGLTDFPKVKISDSLTSAFVKDITELVFSGVNYYFSPNVLDSETLLRVWKSGELDVIENLSELELLRNSNPLRADVNDGPADTNWERYFLRLPPAYGRNGGIWQKVNLICQNFGYWGSSINPELMACPPEETKPRIYEEVHLLSQVPSTPVYLYSEPYLYSAVVPSMGPSSEYGNSCILPEFDQPYDDFSGSLVSSFDPLHLRQADTFSPIGRGYGDWEGDYLRSSPCSELSGFLNRDLVEGVLEPIPQPIWDSSIYKAPLSCLQDQASSTVDSNHYKVGYAFFTADLSAAEEGVFDLVEA